MKKLIDYILSVIYLPLFGLILVVFHAVQWICFNVFGAKAHQESVNVMNWFIVYGWLLTGSTVRGIKKETLPIDRPIIFIANHKSMFDIPGIIWFWRQHTPLFVSKRELAKGIPGISYNLRVGKAALIDRNDRKSAMIEIGKLGTYIYFNNYSAVIFPEGTRSKTKQLKDFQIGGVAILLKKCPNALVVPLAIKNTGVFNPSGIFPLTSFTKLSYTSLKPIEPATMGLEELLANAKGQIEMELGLT